MCGIALIDGSHSPLETSRLQGVLAQRGPDHTEICSITEELTMIGCVLHIQGLRLTPQPYGDDEGNFLLWNGEVFGVCNSVESNHHELFHFINHHGDESDHNESDTIMVSRLLQSALSMVTIQDEKDIDNDVVRTNLLLQLGTSIASALSAISGPYAFIYYCKKFRCYLYGRDPFGRRSLLIKQSQDNGKVLIVASVRPFDDDGETNSLGEPPPMTTSKWIDVPVQGIYVSSIAHKDAPPILIPWPAHRLRLGYQSLSLPKRMTTIRLSTEESSNVLLPWQQLLAALKHAIKVRIASVKGYNHNVTSSKSSPDANESSSTTTTRSRSARIGVLFSGGIDSVVLAAVAHLSMDDENEPIDLLNISFDGSTTSTDNNSGIDDVAPDRLAAVAALDELQQLYPTRAWRLVHVDVATSERIVLERRVKQLIYPCNTHMDLNIGMAFHAAATANHAYLRLYSATEFAASKVACDGSGRPLVRWGGEDAAKSVGRRPAIPKQPSTLPPGLEAGTATDDVTSRTSPVGGMHNPSPCGNINGCFRVVPKKGCIRSLCKRCCNAYENATAAAAPMEGINTLLLCSVHKSRAAIAATTNQHQQTPTTTSTADDEHLPLPHQEAEVVKIPYVSGCRALLIGIGADEQCAGYGRHRTTFLKGGESALLAELDMDCRRLWERNLGRDDRCVADSGREAWFPYLDEGVVQLLQSLDISSICNLHLPPGEGDKVIIRQLAYSLGLRNSSVLVKRAIQFGTKIAKITNRQHHGSNRKGSGTSLLEEEDV